jgi:hypothetical protein
MANPTKTDLDGRPLVLRADLYDNTKTIVAGQGVLAAGSVLGIITTGGKLQLTDKALSTGCEVARYVLTKDVDTTADVVGAPVLKMGKVNAAKLIFGGTSAIADHITQLADNGIAAVIPDASLENLDN